MKPLKKLPKFLMVNDNPEKMYCNRFLPKPYKQGEIVKVAPEEEQHRCKDYDDKFRFIKPGDDDDANFKKRYVVIYRKGNTGKFDHKCVQEWKNLAILTKK